MKRSALFALGLAALPLLAAAAPALAAGGKPHTEPMPPLIEEGGAPLTLEAMNDYFRGKTCEADYRLKITFGKDGEYRHAYPDATSYGIYEFAPGIITVRYTAGSAAFKIGKVERFKAARLESGQYMMVHYVLRCPAR